MFVRHVFHFLLRKKLFNFKYSQEIQLLSQDENGLFYERRDIEELSVNGEETWTWFAVNHSIKATNKFQKLIRQNILSICHQNQLA